MPGDYVHIQTQSTRRSNRTDVGAGAQAAVVLLAPRSASHTLFIQRIVWSITTHAGKEMAWTDDHSGTDTTIAAHTDAAAGAGVPSVVVWDFGPYGLPLTQGASLTLTGNAAGSGTVGVSWVEGYEKQTGAVSVAAS
jgi:hypothetical protein